MTAAKTLETEQDKVTDGTRARYSHVKHVLKWITFPETPVRTLTTQRLVQTWK